MPSRSRVALLAAVALYALTVRITAQRGGPSIGQPLDGLTPSLTAAFNAGARTFAKRYEIADGLGPVFNDESCSDCHRTPVVGGAGNRLVTRFGRVDDGFFDPLIELGGSLIQTRGIGSVTTPFGSFRFDGERVPPTATVVARRRTTGLQGLGLVDGVSDDAWIVIARAEAAVKPDAAGRVSIVLNLLTRQPAVGKFGCTDATPAPRRRGRSRCARSVVRVARAGRTTRPLPDAPQQQLPTIARCFYEPSRTRRRCAWRRRRLANGIVFEEGCAP